MKKPSGEVGYVPSNFVSRLIKPKQRKTPSVNYRPLSPFNQPERNPMDEDDDLDLGIVATVTLNYSASQVDELTLRRGEKVIVQEKSIDGWWKGESNGRSGWFPSSFVKTEPVNVSGSTISSANTKGEENVTVSN